MGSLIIEVKIKALVNELFDGIVHGDDVFCGDSKMARLRGLKA